MRALVLYVVIQILTASYTDQYQYPNDENQIRRFKISRYLTLTPKTIQNDQNRLNDGLRFEMLYPQSNTFVYDSRPIVPNIMKSNNNIYKNEVLRRISHIIWRSLNRLVTKIPNHKRLLHRFLLKEIIYMLRNGKVTMNRIKYLIIKLLQSKGISILNTNKTHKKDSIKFTTHKTKQSGTYQEVLENSTGFLFTDKLNEFTKENSNKQIQNIAKSKSENNIGVSGKNNQENSKILIKNLHVNVGGKVSNMENKSITKNNADKAISYITIIKSPNRIINSTNNPKNIYNRENQLIGEINSLNASQDDQRLKYSSSQSDNSTAVSAKDNTIVNFKEQYNIKNGNQKALDYAQPNVQYHIDLKNGVLKKNSYTFINRGPEAENNIKYNIKNISGYHNLHQISQGTDDLEKDNHYIERTYKQQAIDNLRDKIQNNKYQILKLNKVKNHTNQVENSQKDLDYALPQVQYHIHSKEDVLRKNYSGFINRELEQENNIKYNLKNMLGYFNLHDINRGTDDLEKDNHHNDRTYKKQALDNLNGKIQNKEYQILKLNKVVNDTSQIEKSPKTGKQDIRQTVTENLLGKDTSSVDQSKARTYYVPIEFEIEDLGKSDIPYHSQEIKSSKSNYNGKENSSSSDMAKWKYSGKEKDQENIHMTKDREEEKSMEFKKVSENDLHKVTNLQDTQTNLLIDSMKPLEITKTHREIVKETKTITFADRSELVKQNQFTDNYKKTNLEDMNALFFLKGYDSPPPVKKVIVTDHETSNEIKINNNNGNSYLLHVILHNLSLFKDKDCKNYNANNKKNALINRLLF